jgi:hypothetical protein
MPLIVSNLPWPLVDMASEKIDDEYLKDQNTIDSNKARQVYRGVTYINLVDFYISNLIQSRYV